MRQKHEKQPKVEKSFVWLIRQVVPSESHASIHCYAWYEVKRNENELQAQNKLVCGVQNMLVCFVQNILVCVSFENHLPMDLLCEFLRVFSCKRHFIEWIFLFSILKKTWLLYFSFYHSVKEYSTSSRRVCWRNVQTFINANELLNGCDMYNI